MHYSVKDITYIALFTALTITTALFTRFASGVIPFSLLPFIVMLGGGILGSKRSTASMGLYVLLGLMGIPVFATPPFGGFVYLLQPSFGFLIGFIVAAYVIGKINEVKSFSLITSIFANFLGILVMYLIGLAYFWGLFNFYLGKSITILAVVKIVLPLIIPDLVKALGASYLALVVRKRLKLYNIDF
ncbi:biotin transporter BioY [Bacillota bacterium LX-D]|nr:biotin transporter BioY [Bacillota bacterium LX-D]